jgi:hypothetical protein
MVDKALENAKEIAELTGRTTKEVIADILDDGILNNSIQENTSAIDKATVTAEKLQKLITAVIPILVLIAGSGLELGGVIDLTPAGDGDDDWAWEDDEYYYPEPTRYGCTDYDALNYDEYADEDDGTCEYEEPEPIQGCTDSEADNYNEEAEEDDGSCTYTEPEPEPECEPEYYDYYVSYGDANNTTIEFTYDVDISCDETQQVEVQFLAYVNGSGHGDLPYNYTIDEFNTTYQDWDSRTVTLGDFENGTYDIYAYLINEHGDMLKESKWYNIELKARDE